MTEHFVNVRRARFTPGSYRHCGSPQLLTVSASVLLVLFKFVRCCCNVFDIIVSP